MGSIGGYVFTTDIIDTHSNNESVLYIKENIRTQNVSAPRFVFKQVSNDQVLDKIRQLNSKKSAGCDNFPPKLIKLGASILCQPLTYIINKCIQSNIFPNALKYAEVSPIFKKNSSLDKCNYRPVSVLPCFSKIVEGILIDQMNGYMEPMFSPHLSGFRKGHGCQHVLLNMAEQCKSNLDNNGISAALLTDLSRAFDCLSHKLIISKLYAYGFNKDACFLIANYFTNRKQRVKVGNARSDWLSLLKGAPHGSLIGPFVYNVLSNDLLFIINYLCSIYNYADDNSICVHGNDVDIVIRNIEAVSDVMLKWFHQNYLQANPEKFQFMLMHKTQLCNTIKIGDILLQPL